VADSMTRGAGDATAVRVPTLLTHFPLPPRRSFRRRPPPTHCTDRCRPRAVVVLPRGAISRRARLAEDAHRRRRRRAQGGPRGAALQAGPGRGPWADRLAAARLPRHRTLTALGLHVELGGDWARARTPRDRTPVAPASGGGPGSRPTPPTTFARGAAASSTFGGGCAGDPRAPARASETTRDGPPSARLAPAPRSADRRSKAAPTAQRPCGRS
jgi:hypothetical protein